MGLLYKSLFVAFWLFLVLVYIPNTIETISLYRNIFAIVFFIIITSSASISSASHNSPSILSSLHLSSSFSSHYPLLINSAFLYYSSLHIFINLTRYSSLSFASIRTFVCCIAIYYACVLSFSIAFLSPSLWRTNSSFIISIIIYKL